MAELPFWDEECLRGSIERAPLPPPPKSLFENDLFCDEFMEPLPPSTDLEFAEENFLVSPARNPQLSPYLLQPQTPPPPLPPPPPPLPPTPPRAVAQNGESSSPRVWRSFLDDNCPLRKRVKVTITPQARGKRVATNLPSPSRPAKKPRSSTPPPTREGTRRLQTKLRLSRSGDLPGRITLHVPSPHEEEAPPSDLSSVTNGKTEARSAKPNANPTSNNLTTDLHDGNHLNPDLASNDSSAANAKLHDERESDLDLGDDLRIMNEHFIPNLEQVLDDTASLPDEMKVLPPRDSPPPMRPRVSGTPHAACRSTPFSNYSASGRSQSSRSRNCLTNDLLQRLGNLSRLSNPEKAGAVEKDSGRSCPLVVNAAVHAVNYAAQTYASLMSKATVQPPPVVLTNAWLLPRKTTFATKGGRTKESVASGKTGRSGARRKRGKRRRTLLSFDDHDVAPLGDGMDGHSAIQLGEQLSPLARYMNSPGLPRHSTAVR